MVAATIIWFYLLKNNDLSLAYPLISIGYVFAALAAVFFLHETIPLTRWICILFIMIDVLLLTRA